MLAAVAPCVVPSERRILVTPGFPTVSNPVPLDPEVPLDPDVPDDPDVPLDPDDPDVPLDPDDPEVPLDPDEPDEPEVPDDPDLPATDISTSISSPEVGAHPVPETYATGNSQYNPASAGLPVTLK